MSWLLIAIGIMAIWHYWWEIAIAPSARLKLRFELFRLRDKLRELRYTKPNDLSPELFEQLSETVNTGIQILKHIDPFFIFEARRAFRKDEQLARVVRARLALIESAIEEVQDIHRGVADIAFKALPYNVGGWYVYIVPPIIVFCAAATGVELIQRLVIKPIIQPLVALTELEVVRLIPSAVPNRKESAFAT